MALVSLGIFYWSRGKPDEAVDQQRSAIDVYAMVDLSRSLSYQGRARKQDLVAELCGALAHSVIRSGDSFLIGTPGPVPTAPAGMFIAPLVVEWGYDVEYERARQFQRWLHDNEPAIASSAPAGVSYRGTYAVFATASITTDIISQNEEE